MVITKRQKQILDFLDSFQQEKGYGPVLREIKDYFGLASESTVHQHLKALQNKGLLDESKSIIRDVQLRLTEPVEKLSETEKDFKPTKYEVNRIYNSDCVEFMRGLPDESVDLIFADPPYNLSRSKFKMKFYKSGGADLDTNKGAWDNIPRREYEDFTENWIKEAFRITKTGGALWVAGTYHNIYTVGYLLERHGFEILNEILWHKTDATPNLSCTRFVADHENFLWARKGHKSTFNYREMVEMNGGKQMRSIWPKGKTTGGKKLHPTQKPEWLLERIIRATSKPGALIFDPFMGAGTTAVVAKRLGRNYLGTELDKEYLKIANQRLRETK